jgi:hypothetical protein
MNPQELRTLIQQTLEPHDLYSPEAEELLMATCANESHLGQYRMQIDGPARGIFQEEQEDLADLYTNFLKYHPQYLNAVGQHTAEDLVENDSLAILVCRLHYYRFPDKLPEANDIEGIWSLYKLRYNTPEGAATHDGFMACYQRYVLGTVH